MFKIFKYPLEVTDTQKLALPAHSEILTVQNQNEQICIWAFVNEEYPQTDVRKIRIIGTGNPVPKEDTFFKYIGTVQMMEGKLVWHVFEEVDLSAELSTRALSGLGLY